MIFLFEIFEVFELQSENDYEIVDNRQRIIVDDRKFDLDFDDNFNIIRKNLNQRIINLKAQNRILQNQQRLRELKKENRRFVVEIVKIALEAANSSALTFIKKIVKLKKMRFYKNQS